jgi:CoA:oxalate CoA-transferase
MTASDPRPLAGMTVVDLTRILAGPYCTLVLANLGARVIKVEQPGIGDFARGIGPFVGGKSLYFAALNYDKESIALDLKRAEDRAVFDELLGAADVLVENFRPGSMERLGYGWEAVHARWPRLVYGAASGFGHTGPLRLRRAYDMVVQAMGGILSLTGPRGGPPARVGISIGDIAAGLFLTVGIQAALVKRAETGHGSFVDVAMLDCQLAILENALTAHLVTGVVPGPLGTRHPNIAPFQVFEAGDGGRLVICAGHDDVFQRVCAVLGAPALAEDARFLTTDSRRVHVDALEAELTALLAARPADEWLRLLVDAGVPCAPVNTVADAVRMPQIAARHMIVNIQDAKIGTLGVAGNPIKMSDVPERESRRPPPELDADRASILRSLRCDEKKP